MNPAKKLKEILRRHKLAFVVSGLLGLVYISLHVFLIQEATVHRETYTPVIIEGSFDEGYYALRAAEAFDGRLVVGDINLTEHADSPSFLPILNPLVMGIFGRLSGSIENAFVLSDFLFIVIISLFVYFLTFELTEKRLPSVAFTALFMIAPKFGLFPSSGVLPFFESARELYFSRFEYPNVTYMFFAAALYLLIRALKRQERSSTIAAGVAIGALFYTYLYDWMFIFTGLAAMCVIFFLQGDIERLKRILKIGGIALIVSVPYWFNFIQVSRLPDYADLVERIGVERGRRFRFEIVWFSYVRNAILILALFAAGVVRKNGLRFAFTASFLVPIFFLLNLQLLTGFVPHPDHWHRTQFLAIGLSWLIIFLALAKAWHETVLPIPERLKRAGALVIIAGSLGFGIVNNYTLAKESAPLYYKDSAYAFSYGWFRQNSAESSVVASVSSRTNNEVILYTGNKIFVPNGLHTVVSTDEIWERMMLAARMFNLTPEEFRAAVSDQTLYLFTDAYRNSAFNDYFKHTKRKIPDDVLSVKTERYAELRGQTDPIPYKVNYAVLGERERAFGADDTVLRTIGREVFRAKGVIIYALETPSSGF